MSKDGIDRDGVPEDKEKLSRLTRRHQKEARKKRKVLLLVILAIGVVLAVGAVLNIPYINVARSGGSWLGEQMAGTTDEGSSVPDYLFLTQPQGGKKLTGEVSILLALFKGEGPQQTIMALELFTFNTDTGEGEVYLIPETSVAYDAAGGQITLSDALKREGGRDLLRSTVNNLSGLDVDYLVLLGFNGAIRAFQDLGFPPVYPQTDLVLYNPVSGDTSHLSAGQVVGDPDRLVSYLLATDVSGDIDVRLERMKTYFPEAFDVVEGIEDARIEETLSGMDGEITVDAETGQVDNGAPIAASMIRAFAALPEGQLAFKAVPKVEVLNGCGVPDLGKKVGDRLSSLGVPVAGTGGNAKVTVDGQEINDFSHQQSSIIYRNEDPRVSAFARYLGVLLSVGDIRFEPGPGPDVVLSAGRDMAG